MSEITVKAPKTNRAFTAEKDFGADLAQMVSLWSEKVIFEKATSQLCTDLGNSIRQMLNKEQSDEDIAAFVANYVPGVIHRAGGTRETIKAAAAKLAALKNDPNADPAEIERLRGKIRAYLAEAEALRAAVEEE